MASVVRNYVMHSDNGGCRLFLLGDWGDCRSDARSVSIIKGGVNMAKEICSSCYKNIDDRFDLISPGPGLSVVCEGCMIEDEFPTVVDPVALDPIEVGNEDFASHAD